MTEQLTAYLVFDTETIPDAELVRRVKFGDTALTAEEALACVLEESRANSPTGSPFLPLTYQLPIALCVARIGPDFRLQAIRALDWPRCRPRFITEAFWKGYTHYQPILVTFNGRAFDIPLLELIAFRYGISVPYHFSRGREGARYRYGEAHIDLRDFLTNYGGFWMDGGLDICAKLLGKPGKIEMTGEQVYDHFRQGNFQLINDHCSFDVLDTYFTFLRTRLMIGAINLETEQQLVGEAKGWLEAQCAEQPHFRRYLDRWGDWQPWP